MDSPDKNYTAAELRLRESLKEAGVDPDGLNKKQPVKAKKKGIVMGHKTYISRATTSDRVSSISKNEKILIVKNNPGVIIKENFHCCLCFRKHFSGYEYADNSNCYF